MPIGLVTADGGFEGSALPNIDDCTGMLNNMNESSNSRTGYFYRYDIMTFVNNTCVMNLDAMHVPTSAQNPLDPEWDNLCRHGFDHFFLVDQNIVAALIR